MGMENGMPFLFHTMLKNQTGFLNLYEVWFFSISTAGIKSHPISTMCILKLF
jgi:hypothetical protein